MSVYQSRFSDALWYNKILDLSKDTVIVVGGVGGIGGWLTVPIGRMGFTKFLLVDPDQVEEVNLAGQMYGKSDIGIDKVDAIGRRLQDFNPLVSINTITGFVDETLNDNIIAIYGKDINVIFLSCFDNMKARKDMFNSFVNFPNKKLFMDGRLTAELLEIFTVQAFEKEIVKYKEYLFEDTEVKEAPCSFKQTTHLAMLIAGFMSGILSNLIVNISSGKNIYEVPFYHQYILPLNIMNIYKL